MDQKNIDDYAKRERNITHLIIINTIFMCIIRIPEIVAITLQVNNYYLKTINGLETLCTYYDCGSVIEFGDFILPLNGLFQFIVFFF